MVAAFQPAVLMDLPVIGNRFTGAVLE